MANIPGATNILPGVITDVVTASRSVTLGAGTRLAAIIGEGSTDETIAPSATGSGKDGLNPTYTSTSGSDGRHFQLRNFPLISNRTKLFKNGILLKGLESLIDANPFSYNYDYRVDILTGRVELQRAHLVDQGGSFYTALSTNVGVGILNSLTLSDPNSPPEVWTVRCISVQRTALNLPIVSTAKFVALGSISGSKLDANGNPVIWAANNNVVTNGVLSFAIQESNSGAVPFREGDAFTIKVASGVLNRSESLTANYVPAVALNSPALLQGLGNAVARHGVPSLDNNLSLGCQLATANGAQAYLSVQAAPPMPRRTSYILSPAVNANSTNTDDFIYPLPIGVVPNFNSDIHVFVKNNTTNIEKQLLPNKLSFYSLDTAGNPTTTSFINDSTPAPGGFSFFYTVKQSLSDLATGFDGYIARNPAFTANGLFSSSIVFDTTYVGKTLKLIDATNVANINTYTVNAVTNGALSVTAVAANNFTNAATVAFQVVDPSTNLPLTSGTDGTLVSIIGTGTGTFNSVAVNFNLITSLLGKRLKINGNAANNGLYDITAYNAGTNTLTLQTTVVSENNLRYEILDPTAVSNYVVLNKNVVPDGNGLRVTIVDAKDASYYDAGWLAALASLETVECDIVVPLPKQTISVIFQNTLAHCRSMSSNRNRKERVMFAGAISGLVPGNLTGASLTAVENIGILEGIQGYTITDILAGNVEDLANYSVSDAFGNTFRAVYFYPDQIVVQAGTDNLLMDGFYMAAAAAGYLSASSAIQEPLTNKVLSGFSILANKTLSNSTMESLAAAGVCVVQPVSGGGIVKWGLTTSQSGFVEDQEISIVFIRDRVAKVLRSAFAGYIGHAETPDTGVLLNAQAVVTLNALTSQALISNYAGLSVQRDTLDPRQWNISVRVAPVYPINWIYIKVSVGQLG